MRALVYHGCRVTAMANRLLPGKLHADVLLLANARTRCALPPAAWERVVEIVETAWTPRCGVPRPLRWLSLLHRRLSSRCLSTSWWL